MIEAENKIVQQAKSGHSPSFGLLYDQYQPQIYRFIFLKVSHKEEAEDLTHQVFLSAWQNIARYEERNLPFSSWLYRIARNKVIDHYRTSRHHRPLDEALNLISSDEQLDQATDKSLRLDLIRQTLLQATPEQQDVLIMRFVEDMPIKEVADSLGKTPGAVKLIQFRAINKIKKILQPPTPKSKKND